MHIALETISETTTRFSLEEGSVMDAGAKITLTRTIRSSKTGMLLPREGKLISVTENLGRTLFLVSFENGQSEYLFQNELEVAESTAMAEAAKDN